MKPTISLIQIILGVLLIVSVILQQKGSGIGSSFGGDSAMFRTKRGAEKLLFYGTMVLAALFVISALVGLLIK